MACTSHPLKPAQGPFRADVQLTAAEIAFMVKDSAKQGRAFAVEWVPVAVALRESGGCMLATVTDTNGTVSRGLFQFNKKDKAHITDDQAYASPIYAAWMDTKGGTDWSCWGIHNLIPGTKEGCPNYQAPATAQAKLLALRPTAEAALLAPVDPQGKIAEAVTDEDDTVTEQVPGDVFTGPGGVFDIVGDWTEGLRKLLSFLTSAAFWRRVGIGALGLFLVVLAVALMKANTIGKALT